MDKTDVTQQTCPAAGSGQDASARELLRTMSQPPRPIPPKPPVPGECCERGCEMCMWTYYYEAQRRYEAAEADWRRQYESTAGT